MDLQRGAVADLTAGAGGEQATVVAVSNALQCPAPASEFAVCYPKVTPVKFDAPPAVQPLLAVVELLETEGNLAVDGGFVNSQAGRYCRMRLPLNAKLIRDRIAWSSNWVVAEGGETILDRSTWSAVVGPGSESVRPRKVAGREPFWTII